MNRSYKFLNTVTAVGSLVNGFFYLAAPAFSLSLLGQAAAPIGLMNTRVAGAIALGMCVINWMSRDIKEIHIQRIVVAGNLSMFFFLVVVEIQGTLMGAMNWVGWLYVFADSLLGIGYLRILLKSYGSSD